MRRLTRTGAGIRLAASCLLATTLAAVGSCGGPNTSGALSPPPVWDKVALADLPADFVNFEPSSASASRYGFFATSAYSPWGGPDQDVFTSVDGRSWHRRAPGGLSTLATGTSLATDGKTTWLLGGEGFATAHPAVWSTKDGSTWSAPVSLPQGPDVEVPVTVAAGPKGVMVVSRVTPGRGKPDELKAALRVRVSAPSGAFTRAWDVPCPGSDGQEGTAEALADDNGFHLVAECWNQITPADALFDSADGGSWKRQVPPADGNKFTHLARNGPVTVLTGGLAASDVEQTTEPKVWYKTGDGPWHTAAPLDPGRLPDAGVVPRHDQAVLAVTAAGTGFIAVGGARSADDSSVGALWFSPDGRQWTKQPTHANGFDELRSLAAVTARDGTIVVLGSKRFTEVGSAVPLNARIWIGRIGAEPSSIRTASALSQFAGTWSWTGASITIDSTGRLSYRYLTNAGCATHSPPCDENGAMGGRATGTVRPGPAANEAQGTLKDPIPIGVPAGAPILLTREPYGAIDVNVDGRSYGLFCEPGSSRCANPIEN